MTTWNILLSKLQQDKTISDVLTQIQLHTENVHLAEKF